MLRVLQHYFPVRTFLLVSVEALLLWAVTTAGMTHHLWDLLVDPASADPQSREVAVKLTNESLLPRDALFRCGFSSALVTLTLLLSIGLNRLYEFQITASRYERASRFVESAGIGIALTLGLVIVSHLLGADLLYAFPGLSLSEKIQVLVATVSSGFGILYLGRFVYHAFIRRAELDVRVLILGSRGPAHALANQIIAHPEAGFRVVGLVPEPATPGDRRRSDRIESPITASEDTASEATEALVFEGIDLLGRESKSLDEATRLAMAPAQGEETLTELLEKLRIEMVVVALEDRRLTLPIEDLLRARLAGVEVREREEVYEQVTGRIAVAAMRPSYLIFNEGFRRHPFAALLKRVNDVVVAAVMLLLLWWVMVIVAVVVRLTSPGPILFTQERVGQDGRPFVLMKFRSMRADAEKLSGPVWATEDDPRITRFGKFMRKTRLDELPQLFNVLSGSMSLVGPRPERQHFVDQLAARIPYFQLRHIVKPGVTGWAQTNYPYGNTEEDALHKLQYDLFYIKNYSVLFDLSILVSTIKTVVLRRGT
jgi:sugar transferase (PEP-CTERM system associated)